MRLVRYFVNNVPYLTHRPTQAPSFIHAMGITLDAPIEGSIAKLLQEDLIALYSDKVHVSDVTDTLEQIAGPFEDFHHHAYTPKKLALDAVVVYMLTGDELVFEGDDVIHLDA